MEFKKLLINLSKRKCPCCNNRVIMPFDFKKMTPYYCLSCGSHIEPSTTLSLVVTILIVSFSVYLGSIGLIKLSLLVLVVIFLRNLFLDKIDALLLPLHEHL